MTDAQKILADFKGTDVVSVLARKYSADPDKADAYIRELHFQTHTNMRNCVKSWGQSIVDRIKSYCDDGKTR